MSISDLMIKMTEKPVFLLNDQEGIAIRSTPGPAGNTFARFPGGKEFEVKEDSNLVISAILMQYQITEAEYLSF